MRLVLDTDVVIAAMRSPRGGSAELLRRLGRSDEARDAYRQALLEGDDLAILALVRLGSQRGYPVLACR